MNNQLQSNGGGKVDHVEFRRRLKSMRNNRSTQHARNVMHKKSEDKGKEEGDAPPPWESATSSDNPLADLSPEMQEKLRESVSRVALEERRNGNVKNMSQEKLLKKVMEDFNKNNSS